jgi:hypothetical protein
MKKLAVVLLVTFSAFAALSACDGKEGEKSKTKDKTKTEATK